MLLFVSIFCLFVFHCFEGQEDDIVDYVNGERNGNNPNTSSICISAQNCLFNMLLRMCPGQVDFYAMCSGKAKNMDCLLIHLL